MAPPHPDFGLLASNTVKQSISVVYSHTVDGTLLQPAQKTNTGGIPFKTSLNFPVLSLENVDEPWRTTIEYLHRSGNNFTWSLLTRYGHLTEENQQSV